MATSRLRKRKPEDGSAAGTGQEEDTGDGREAHDHVQHLDEDGHAQDALEGKIADVEEQKLLVSKGEHDDLKKSMASLIRSKEKRIAAADRYRKLQIKAINEMYEYELKVAEADFQTSLEVTKDRMLEKLDDEIRKLRVCLEEKANRSLRSKGKGPEELVSLKNSTRRKMRSTLIPNELENSLSLPDIHSDFKEIIEDLHTRSVSNASQRAVDASDGVLVVGSQKFKKNSAVVVFSVLTNEEFPAILTSITPKQLLVRALSGVCVRIYISQIRHGRVRIAPDLDAEELNMLILESQQLSGKRPRHTEGAVIVPIYNESVGER